MREDTEPAQHHEDEGSGTAPASAPTHVSFREHLVRETLSDLENELTADHHLESDLDREPKARPVPSGHADGR